MTSYNIFTKLFLIAGCGLCLAGCSTSNHSATITDFSVKASPSHVHFTKQTGPNRHQLTTKGHGYTPSKQRAEQLARAYQKVMLARLRPHTFQVRIDKIVVTTNAYQVRYTSLTTSNKSQHERVTFYYNGLITMAAKGSTNRNTGLYWR